MTTKLPGLLRQRWSRNRKLAGHVLTDSVYSTMMPTAVLLLASISPLTAQIDRARRAATVPEAETYWCHKITEEK